MNRRNFLRSAGGLILGAEALETLARLEHKRKFFPGWSPSTPDVWSLSDDQFVRIHFKRGSYRYEICTDGSSAQEFLKRFPGSSPIKSGSFFTIEESCRNDPINITYSDMELMGYQIESFQNSMFINSLALSDLRG